MIRGADKWLLGYLRSVMNRPQQVQGPRHLMVCLADHFEPMRGRDSAAAREVVERWGREYPKAVEGFRDADGMTPKHTFFYPQEEYDEDCLNQLRDLCATGHGEVELHLHHRNDTPEGLRAKLTDFRDTLHNQHGLLGSRVVGDAGSETRPTNRIVGRLSESAHTTEEHVAREPVFAFIHGNWALCNSRPDGDWCGVNEELGILSAAGCYADFTFPSAPSPTQPRTVNTIYRANDAPGRSRGHDRGARCRVCSLPPPQSQRLSPIHHSPFTIHQQAAGLLMVQGPLALNWRRRKWGVLPRLENGAITGVNPPTGDRIDLWVRQHIHVAGRPEWVFVKVHTHGCVESNADIFLAQKGLHEDLQSRYNDGNAWWLHYVTAREMVNMVRAAEDGLSGNPCDFRDYEIAPPPVAAP